MSACYAFGEGVSQDVVEAARWRRNAAEQGGASDQFILGGYYATGKGVTKDMAEAVMWWRKAADQGEVRAQIELGHSYAIGYGVTKDMAEAAMWWRKAADQDDASAQKNLGICYANGYGVPKNQILGHMWLKLVTTHRFFIDDGKELLILESQMTAAQIAEANNLAANFKPMMGNGQPKIKSYFLAATDLKDSMGSVPALRHLPSDERLTSGSILTDNLAAQGGKGKLTLDNGLIEDAFVKMLRNDRLVASFYVRGGERFNFSHVPDGVYKLIYCTGFGWDAGRRDFARGRHAVRYDEPLDFLTTRRTEGNTIITSTGVITLTLHKVANGNTSTSDISLEEFDSY